MATIDDSAIIRKIISNNGTFPGDPQLFAVLSYVNNWGKDTFAICTSAHILCEYLTSPYIHSPQLLWSCDAGLTPAGSLFLNPTASHEEESE
jgi:hypothetical protein